MNVTYLSEMVRWIALALAMLLFAAPASANSRLPATNQLVIAPDDTSFMLLRSTFGFLFSRDAGKTWDWLCEDAIAGTGQLDPAVALLAGGAVLSAESGLAVSADRGCSWTLAPGTETTIVPDVARGADGASAIAVTNIASFADDAGVLHFDTSILETANSGNTWTPLAGVIDPLLTIDTIDLAKSDPLRIYVTGIQYGATVAKMLVSTDGGGSYVEHDIPLTGKENGAFIAAVDPNNADVVYVRTLGPINGGTGLGSRLLVTTDAGKTFTAHWSGDKMLGFALSPDGTRVYLGSALDGLLVANASDLVFTQRSTLSVQCLATLGNTLFACSSEPSAHAVTGAPFVLGASTDEGTTFAPLLTLAGIRGPLQCPPSSIATTKCVPEWPVLAEQLAIDAGTPDAGGEPSKTGGCGCDTSDGSASTGLLLVAVALIAALARRLRA
jgi:MYXO-CTERM domain-containing protein